MKPRTMTYGYRSLSFSMTQSIRVSSSLAQFRFGLKTHLFSVAFRDETDLRARRERKRI
jgi:hypothetical protein